MNDLFTEYKELATQIRNSIQVTTLQHPVFFDDDDTAINLLLSDDLFNQAALIQVSKWCCKHGGIRSSLQQSARAALEYSLGVRSVVGSQGGSSSDQGEVVSGV